MVFLARLHREGSALPLRRAGDVRGQSALRLRVLLHETSARRCFATTSEEEMTMMEVQPAGNVGDVGSIGDKWAFTLYDNNKCELLTFVFVEEGEARRAAKA